jgi:methionyl-tRNA synthetase
MSLTPATPFYLTTAIDYANGAPHLGHAYEKVLADVIIRFQRLQGRPTHFLTGLDEHGQKVQQTAAKRGITPQEACDETAALFQTLLRELNISNDDYIRTTQPRHKAVVQHYLQQLFDAGQIYKAEYTGYYSVRQEQFVLEKDKNPDGTWPEIFGDVTSITEANYFFRLSQYQPWLIEFLNANPDWVFPRFRQKQVLEFLKEPINDLCISRPLERLAWGIPLPFDPGFVTYVWFDALVNYASAVADRPGLWDAGAHHVIGKDILVPPHSVYWPCMLKALGLAQPAQLIVHGWWTLGGSKASKSSGNALNSLELANLYGPDVFRYYVIREMNVGQDADFSADQFRIRYKTDLGNDLGNLLNRLLNMANRYSNGTVPPPAPPSATTPPATQVSDPPAAETPITAPAAPGNTAATAAATAAPANTAAAAPGNEPPETELRALWDTTAAKYLEHAAGYQFHLALETLWVFVRAMNRYVEHRAPWKLGKSPDPADRLRLESSLAHLAEGLRLAATALTPVMPATAAKILQNIGLPAADTFTGGQLVWDFAKTTAARLAEKAIIFPPIEEPAAAAV